jgi:hypothetical protein
MGVTTHTVSLTIPHDADLLPLFSMILGGIALRRNLSFETLDDLQLAVDSVLVDEKPGGRDISMSVDLGEEGLDIRLGPLTQQDLRDTLVQGGVPAGATDRCLDVCLILRSLVDDYTVRDHEDGSYAVVLRKLTG